MSASAPHETVTGVKPVEPEVKPPTTEPVAAVKPEALGAAPLGAAANPGATETLGAASMTEVKPAPITEGTLGAAPITEANPEAAKAPEPVAAANLVSDAAKAPDIDDLIAYANKLLQQLQKIKTDKNAQAAPVEPATATTEPATAAPAPATTSTVTAQVVAAPNPEQVVAAPKPATTSNPEQVAAASNPSTVTAKTAEQVAASEHQAAATAHVGGKHRTKTSKRRH